MFERFGDDARQVLVFAHDEARTLEHGYVGTEHLLLGAIEQSAGIAAGLESLGVSLDDLITKIEEGTDPERRRARGPRPYTPRAKRVLDQSPAVAANLGHDSVRPEHILLAAVEGEDVAGNLLVSLGAELVAVRRVMLDLLEHEPIPAERDDGDDETDEDETRGQVVHYPRTAAPELEERLPERRPPIDGGAEPRCPRCDSELTETLQWRQHVAPGPNADPLMVYLLFCSRCGRTLEVRSEE